MKRKGIAAILAMSMVMSMIPVCAKTQAEENVETAAEGITTTITTGETEVVVYYPTPNAADEKGVITICTAPTFLVFPESRVDEAQAMQFAQENGLAAIAAENGSPVCFVNPKGNTWSEEDAAAYQDVTANVIMTTQSPAEQGVTVRPDLENGGVVPAIAGSQARIYVYGIGAGADFLASNVLRPTVTKMFYGYDVDVTPAGATLEGVSVVPKMEANDIPVVSIGNSDEFNAALEAACGSVQVEESRDYAAQYTSVIETHRRQWGKIVPVYNWENEGIVEKVETLEVQTGTDYAGEKYADTETHPVNYIVYYAEDLDVNEGKVPLVFCFHGGGNSAMHEAMMADWPMIGKKNGFITVSIDSHHPDCSASEVMQVLEALKDEYSIDESRIYASGFSMGGCKSWDMFEQYPTVFAGLAPMDASQVPGTDSYDNPVENGNSDVMVPIFYVGGGISPLDELPCQAEKMVQRMDQVFDINKVAAGYDCSFEDAENWADPIWGVSGDLSYEVTDPIFTDSTLTVNLYQSEDGKYYTALALSGNQAHEIYARNSWAAWDFLSQFSRNENGEIEIADITYARVSDDGSVADNSYNR